MSNLCLPNQNLRPFHSKENQTNQTGVSPSMFVPIVTPTTLRMLFRSIECSNAGALSDLCDIIVGHACVSWFEDLKAKKRLFQQWEKNTDFIPKPSYPATDTWSHNPLHEVTTYHGSTFFRPRHCAGVKLAVTITTQLFRDSDASRFGGDAQVFVVWTDDADCRVYRPFRRIEYDPRSVDVEMALHLHNQDVPFRTWMVHLGGEAAVQQEQAVQSRISGYVARHAERLFHDFVVPYFGSGDMLRNPLYMRSLPHSHLAWKAARFASYAVGEQLQKRMTWV